MSDSTIGGLQDFCVAVYGDESEDEVLLQDDAELDETVRGQEMSDSKIGEWRDFYVAVYGDKNGDESEDEDLLQDDAELDETVSDEEGDPVDPNDNSPTPPHSSVPSKSGLDDHKQRRCRDRSRSPIWKPERTDVLRRTPLQCEAEFYDPDAHALYARLEDINDSVEDMNDEVENLNESRSSNSNRILRGRVRVRRGRARNGRGSRGTYRRGPIWRIGQPLQEVWLTDDDVPLELRQMVRDVLRRRKERVEAIERKKERARRLNEGEDSENENDLFEDAIDGKENSLLKGVDDHFDWSPMETFQCVEENFIPEHTGTVTSYEKPYDAFRSYWDDDILQIIVNETNRQASRFPSARFQSDWYPTNAHEVLCLFAFWIMTGIIRMPTIWSYFTSNTLLKTEIFSKITTYDRYNNLTRALNFSNTGVDEEDPTDSGSGNFDRTHRLRPIIDHLNRKFQSNYILSKDICIDKNLTLCKGRRQLKENIQTKAAKFGLNTFELCESATGYLWSFLVYTEKEEVGPGTAKSTAVVLKLIEPLLHKGYRLFMDHCFNYPLLARFLKRNGTDCVGTLPASREDVPQIVTQAPLKQGQMVARHSGDVCVLSWMDRQRVNMISTCHGTATALPSVSSRPRSSRPEPFQPQSFLDYNRCMAGVDLKDQIFEPYLLEQKRCTKWYIKLFKRLLNCSIYNSRILLESSLKERQDNLQFRLALVHGILKNHLPHIPISRRRAVDAYHRRSTLLPHNIQNKHWPIPVPRSPFDLSRNRQTRLRCVVCLKEGKKDQRSRYKCEECDVPLCVDNCFKKFHLSA